jgi:hypothetical protein
MTCSASFMLRSSKLHARARSARVVRPKKNDGWFFLVLSVCFPNADIGPQSAGRCDVSIAIARCVSRVSSCGSSVDIPGASVSPPPKRDIVAYPPETDIARGDVFSRARAVRQPGKLHEGPRRRSRACTARRGGDRRSARGNGERARRGKHPRVSTTRMYTEDARAGV